MRGLLILALFVSTTALAQHGTDGSSWPTFGGDLGSTKYAPLDQINAENVGELRTAWTWDSVDVRIQRENPDNSQWVGATYFECTPLYVDGTLYVSTSLGQAAAIDADSGDTIWSYSSEAYRDGRPPNLGYISRGVGYWADGSAEGGVEERIYLACSNSWLVALDAKTGEPITSFGDNGRADLLEGVPRAYRARGYGHPSAPIIVNGVVVVGSSISDGPTIKEATPGQVKGFDARTGELIWTFNTIAQPGEFGAETWEDGSNAYTGGTNVWTSISADPELGYVYLPTSTPTNDFYGGHRLGDNLFAESLVCVDAATGKRVWHYQIVQHGLWDYDMPCAPNLMDITVDGRTIKAVAQATKHGFVFAFDRATGEPVWPIEERAVPQSTVPGERTSPTQPFPTKPVPFTRQGVTQDDVIDFTPELKQEALAILENFNYGPLFTPPSVDKPTIEVPGYGGGANWPGAALDPESGYLYIPTMNHPSVLAIGQPDPARSNFRYTRSRAALEGPDGLPLLKSPYAEIVALDMNTGEKVWSAVNGGDGPIDHARLRDLNIPPMGSNGRAAALVTKSLLIVTEGSGRSGSATGGGPHLRFFEKDSGELVHSYLLPAPATGNPMTYLHKGKQYIVVAVGSTPAKLVALSL